MNAVPDELAIIISANADQFRKELADVNSRLNSLNAATGGISKTVGKGFTGSIFKATLASQVLIRTVSAVGRGIFNMGKQVVNLGTQYTRLKVATDTVTRNMGMSREEVDRLRGSLEAANTYGSQAENVIKTLALSGLVDLARGLSAIDARNSETVNGVEALVLVMKDLGAAAGIDSAQAIEKLTKFIRRGEVTFADGVIEIGNINQAYQKYATQLGKTLITLGQEERAFVRMNIVMEEGKKTFGAYANTMQTAGKAMDSVKNATTAILERLGNYLEPVFASVARAVFVFVDAVRTSLLNNAQTFKNWANTVAAYVVAVVRILGSLLTRIPGIGQNFIGLRDFALKPVVSTLDSLNESTEGTSNAMEKAAGSTKDLKKELAGLQGFDEMNVIKPPEEGGGAGGVGGAGGALDNLKELFKVEDLNKSVDEINAMAGTIEKDLRKKFSDLAKTLEPVWNILKPIAKWFADNLGTILLVAGAIGVLNSVIGMLVKTFTSFKTIGTVVTSVFTFIVGLFAKGGAMDTVALVAMYAFDAVKVALIGIASALGISVGWVIAIIAALIAITILLIKNWDWVKATAISVWGWLTENVFTPVGAFFTKIFTGMVNTVKGWFNDIKAFFTRIKTEVFDPVVNEIDRIINGLIVPIIYNFILVIKLLWGELMRLTKEAWDYIMRVVIQPVIDWFKANVLPNIILVVDGIIRVWNDMVQGVKSAWEFIRFKVIQPVLDWFSKNIMPIINTVAEAFKTAFQGVADFLGGIWSGIKNIFRDGINWVIDSVNKFINKANDLIVSYNKTVGVLPDAMKITYRFATIPKLAGGGIIENPTFAMLGEAGREAVLPLDNNKEWMQELAAQINGRQGDINLVVKIGEEKIFERAIDYINNKALYSSNTVLNI